MLQARAVDRAVAGRLHGRVLAKGSRGPVSAAKIVALRADGSALSGREPTTTAASIFRSLAARARSRARAGLRPAGSRARRCATSAPLILRLVPRPNLPVYETVVIAPRDEPSVDLRGPELVSTPGSLGDPFRTIESLPGVASVAWPAPIYAIRGSNPGNTGYFLDDVQVPLLFHLALGPSVINPAFFDSMTFYPGGYPARYGRYAAGIVASQTRAPPRTGCTRRPRSASTMRAAWCRHPGPTATAAWPRPFAIPTPGHCCRFCATTFAFPTGTISCARIGGCVRVGLELLLFGSGDDLAYRLNPGDPEREYLLRFHRASLRASRSVGEGRLVARVALGADHSTAPIVQNFPITADAYSIIPRVSYLRETAHVDYEVGVDGQAQWLRPMAGAVEAGASDLARTRTAVLVAGYASASIRATDRLSLTPGLRLDSYTISGVTKSDLGPRLSARLAARRKNLAHGKWRPLFPGAKPDGADPGGREFRARALRVCRPRGKARSASAHGTCPASRWKSRATSSATC
jgi:hypothetical protein